MLALYIGLAAVLQASLIVVLSLKAPWVAYVLGLMFWAAWGFESARYAREQLRRLKTSIEQEVGSIGRDMAPGTMVITTMAGPISTLVVHRIRWESE